MLACLPFQLVLFLYCWSLRQSGIFFIRHCLELYYCTYGNNVNLMKILNFNGFLMCIEASCIVPKCGKEEQLHCCSTVNLTWSKFSGVWQLF
eukprot:m.1012 g.1012  ORF g.1012 m.1012 type:complete len:92 (+) comp5460_c0_seq1:205-480(+)